MRKTLNVVAQILLIVGGLNWGFIGLFQFDLVSFILGGEGAALTRIVYILVGLAALYGLYLLKPVSEDVRTVHTHVS
jgi:uncharacterized membrane protein YuzA (DUF378 family)